VSAFSAAAHALAFVVLAACLLTVALAGGFDLPSPRPAREVKRAPPAGSADYRDRPLPALIGAPTALDYHSVPVDLDDPRAREPLVELTGAGVSALSYYAVADGSNHPYDRPLAGSESEVRARWSVARMLWRANVRLRRYGVELLVLDGYRSIECQRELWRYFMDEAKRKLPRATDAAWRQYAGRYCSSPSRYRHDDYRTWPVHITGGAVDVTLRSLADGRQLDMGSAFDDASPESHSACFEKDRGRAGEDARKTCRDNRRLLYWAMLDAGFTNYPYEWWHYDYGDQLWALYFPVGETEVRMVRAFYGPAFR